MNSLVITRTGTHLTIQDFGRFHYQHLGVSPSGAMDQRIIKAVSYTHLTLPTILRV